MQNSLLLDKERSIEQLSDILYKNDTVSRWSEALK